MLPGDDDSDVLPYPAKVPVRPKKTSGNPEKQKFFVLTAVEAHAAKLKYHQDKQRKQQEKEQKKRQRELKRQEKESIELIKKSKVNRQASKQQQKAEKRVTKKAAKDGTTPPPKQSKSARNLSCACTGCGVVENSKEDLDKGEGWIKCKDCSNWYHDGCAENYGVLDDLYFYCHNCLSS